jgi:poly(hydroxyalkanoate) granule-associated protein
MNDEKKTGGPWSEGLEKYSRQIWLAGLGAYSKISKDGSELFDRLVKAGERAETDADEDVPTGRKSTREKVEEVRGKARERWGEFEVAFDRRLKSAVARLGLPTRAEIEALQEQIDGLTKQVEALSSGAVKPAETATAGAKPTAEAPPVVPDIPI